MIAATTNAATVVSAAVDERAHQLAVAAEEHERDRARTGCRTRARPGSAPAPRTGRCRSRCTTSAGRHRDRAAQEERDPPPDEPLHDDLAGQRPDRRRREPGGEQRDAEDDVGVRRRRSRRARRRPRRCPPTPVSPRAWKTPAADDQHLHVDQPGDGHRDDRRRSARSGRSAPLAASFSPTTRRWVSAECR